MSIYQDGVIAADLDAIDLDHGVGCDNCTFDGCESLNDSRSGRGLWCCGCIKLASPCDPCADRLKGAACSLD